MNKHNIKKGLCALLISLAGLLVGFALISLPFHLFDTLTDTQMKIVFSTELAVYLTIGCSFFLHKEKRAEKEKREKQKRAQRKNRLAEEKQAMNEALLSILPTDTAA